MDVSHHPPLNSSRWPLHSCFRFPLQALLCPHFYLVYFGYNYTTDKGKRRKLWRTLPHNVSHKVLYAADKFCRFVFFWAYVRVGGAWCCQDCLVSRTLCWQVLHCTFLEQVLEADIGQNIFRAKTNSTESSAILLSLVTG